MQITHRTDYGLRVMIFVAAKGESPSTIAEIAEAYGISRSHLMKIVQELSTRGYLDATRGKNGGIRIGRPADQIRIGDIVRDLEPDFGLVECFRSGNECIITPACPLKAALTKALSAFLDTLNEYTVADMASHKPRLAKLLNIQQL